MAVKFCVRLVGMTWHDVTSHHIVYTRSARRFARGVHDRERWNKLTKSFRATGSHSVTISASYSFILFFFPLSIPSLLLFHYFFLFFLF